MIHSYNKYFITIKKNKTYHIDMELSLLYLTNLKKKQNEREYIAC